MRLHCPAVFAASHNSKCIVGLRLGLLGLYKAAALIATKVFTGEIGFSEAMVVTSVAKVVWQHRWDCRAG
jgi:hypothetical protein